VEGRDQPSENRTWRPELKKRRVKIASVSLLSEIILITIWTANNSTVTQSAYAAASAKSLTTINLSIVGLNKSDGSTVVLGGQAKGVQGSSTFVGQLPFSLNVKPNTSISVYITQSPANYTFFSWQGGSTAQPYIFSSKTDTTVQAYFDKIVTSGNTTPPPSSTGTTGYFYVPLYNITNYQIIAKEKQLHPSLKFIVEINPNSGPGNTQDARFSPAISAMRSAGVEVVTGYVPTYYAKALSGIGSPYTGIVYTPQVIESYIDKYIQWYSVNGVSFDEVSTSTDPAVISFYQQIVDYARSKGLAILQANPGTSAPEPYIQMFDNSIVSESGAYPSETYLQSATYYGKYSATKFAVVVHSSQLNETWIPIAKKYVSYIYLTDDGPDGNPYDELPTYLDRELTLFQN
jgi:hypothetical protein